LEDPISTALGLIAVVVLVLANGFFVATEFSLVSVRRTRIQQLAAEGNRRAANVLDRITHLDTYIAATQLGITISSLALGWIGEPVVAVVLENILHYVPIEIGSTTTHAISFIVAFSLVTALHIVIGELAPKSLALQRPEETAMAVAPAIHVFLVIFRPVILALNWVGNRVVKLFGIDPAGGHAMVQSAEELMISIDASRQAGFVNQTAHDLVGRAFSFNDMQARHVMVPRTEVTALPLDSSVDDVIQLAADTSYTRLPVFEGDSDHIVGIIKMKRLFPVFMARIDANAVARTNGNGVPVNPVSNETVGVYRGGAGNDHRTVTLNGAGSANGNGNGVRDHATHATPGDFNIRDYMMEPMLVPETVAASEVLTRMRENHVQMAVVIDEYGGTAGIVTLQDIVTHLIGRIQEQGEQTEPDGPGADGLIHLDGLTGLVELRERYEIDLLSEGYDVETLGGYVFFVLGRPAIVGDEVRAPSGQTFVVEEMDGLRVARVQVVSERHNAQLDADTGDRQTIHAA